MVLAARNRPASIIRPVGEFTKKKPLNRKSQGLNILTAWERLRLGELGKSLHYPQAADSAMLVSTQTGLTG
jgi:hypothetical protein